MLPAKYFECHITIDPPLEYAGQATYFEKMCERGGFKAAKLVKENGAPNDRDAFCTGHGNTFLGLHERMLDLLDLLKSAGFKIKRYKIEAVLLDSRFEEEGGTRRHQKEYLE